MNGGTTLEFLLPFLWRAPPLELRREHREFFPDQAGKGSLLSSKEAETGLLWMWRDSRASSRVETGKSGNFFSFSKGVKDPLEVPEDRCDLTREASEEMGLISLGGENFMDFLELRQVLSTYDGELCKPLRWRQERPVPMRVAWGTLGIPLPTMPRPKTCVESVPEHEDSSPVLTRTSGYFWSLPRGVSPRLVWGHARALSSRLYQQCHVSLRLDQGICGFPSTLSHEAFPRGFPTGLSHVPPLCELILSLKVEAVQGKQVSLEWTETSGGLWEWWHDPGVPLALPVEIASS